MTTYHLALFSIFTTALSQVVNGPDYNSPNGGPPASYFSAAPTIPVAALQSAAAKMNKVPDRATYLISQGSDVKSTIYSDWAAFDQGAAIVWTADMDVDCDGLDYHCEGNPDGQPQTNWGALAAYEVPFIVIPDQYLSANTKTLPGNNIAAVICNGKMYYGILGDSNGDDPQVTGEASWVLARTCFPAADLSGNRGHGEADVTYILFLGTSAVLPPSAVNENYITNFGTLKSMGDNLVNALLSNLGLGGEKPVPVPVPSPTSTGSGSPTPTGCSWVGHCEGSSCSTHDDCSDDLVCTRGVCSVDSGEKESCSWPGHCVGASCTSSNDCSDELICISGICSVDV